MLNSDPTNRAWPVYLAKKSDAIDEFIAGRPQQDQNRMRQNIALATQFWQCKTCYKFDPEKEDAYFQCCLCLELHHESCRREIIEEDETLWSCGCGTSYEFDMEF